MIVFGFDLVPILGNSDQRGPHEIRVGTNIRMFRLNGYDFGEGTVSLVTNNRAPEDPFRCSVFQCL
jgi:hypothetical protein